MIYLFVYKAIDLTFQALYLALMIRVLLSWVPHDRDHPIVSVFYQVTDPILRPFQNIVPSHSIGIDLAPLFAFFALGILRRIIFQIL